MTREARVLSALSPMPCTALDLLAFYCTLVGALCPSRATTAEIYQVMNHLSEAIAALRIVNGLVGVLPFGDKLGAGVGLAIGLCEAIQVRRNGLCTHDERTHTCPDRAIQSGVLRRARSEGFIPARVRRACPPESRRCAHPEHLSQLGFINTVRSSRFIRPTNLKTGHCRVLTEVIKSVDARSTVNKSKIVKLARRVIQAKDEKEVIQSLDRKIRDVALEFEVRRHTSSSNPHLY
jgi:hypothetical protein